MAVTVHDGSTTALGLVRGSASTTSSTVTSERLAASTASFCTPTMPSSSTLPSRSAFCACTIATSGRCAGTAASRSPVNGQSMNRTFGFTAARSDPT